MHLSERFLIFVVILYRFLFTVQFATDKRFGGPYVQDAYAD